MNTIKLSNHIASLALSIEEHAMKNQYRDLLTLVKKEMDYTFKLLYNVGSSVSAPLSWYSMDLILDLSNQYVRIALLINPKTKKLNVDIGLFLHTKKISEKDVSLDLELKVDYLANQICDEVEFLIRATK